MPGEIAESAFVKKYSTESVKKTEKGGSFDVSDYNLDLSKKDGINRSKAGKDEVEKFKDDFNKFKTKFKEQLIHTDIDEKIDVKLNNSFKEIIAYDNDLFQLGLIISELKSDLISKTETQEKTETPDQKFSEILKIDLENNSALNKKISEHPLGAILQDWLGQGKLKELIKIPFLGNFLKGIIGLGENDKFSNEAEKKLGDFKVEKNEKNDFKELLKSDPKKLGVELIKNFIEKISPENQEGKKHILQTFDELSKFDSGIKNYSSKEIEKSEDGKVTNFQIETNGAKESVFLRKELNGAETDDLSNSLDISKVITKNLKNTKDKKQAVENAINEVKQNFNLEDLQKLTETKENIRISEVDENDYTKLNISFISTKEFVKKIEEKTE